MAFAANPLSLAFPSDHVQALLEQQAYARQHGTAELDPNDEDGADGGGRHGGGYGGWTGAREGAAGAGNRPPGGPGASQGPGAGRSPSSRIGALTVADLVKAPRPWATDFFGLEESLQQQQQRRQQQQQQQQEGCYSLPSSFPEMGGRVDANIAEFLGNYIRIFGVMLACVMYKRPLACLGSALLYRLWLEVKRCNAALAVNKHRWTIQIARILLQLAMWATAFCFRVVPAVSLVISLSLAVVLVHSLLRHPPPPLPISAARRGNQAAQVQRRR